MRWGKDGHGRVIRGVAGLVLAGIAVTGCSRSGDDRTAERPGGNRAAAAPGLGQSSAPAGELPAGSPAGRPSRGPDSGGPSVAAESPGPEGDAFFDPPTPLPTAKPGEIIRHRPFDIPNAGVPGAARDVLVMYTTTAPDGTLVAATGTVALPNGPAPEGGWPVVAWDHGTMGIGAKCAPSRGLLAGLDTGFNLQAELIARGIAVVQPDYIGMGVTGIRHPYLQGKPAAHATIDLMRAARALDPGVGRTWFVGGHSQGAHAALWTSHYQPEYAPELPLKGVLAFAPGTGFQLMPALVAQGDATAAPYIGIFLLLVNGAAAADPAVKPDRFLTPEALAAADAAWTDCLGTGTPPPANVLLPNADLAPLTASLESNATDKVTPSAPVLLAQGTTDPLAPLNLPMSQSLCARGATLEYRPYPDQGHNMNGFHPSGPEALAWLQSRLEGAPITQACVF